MIHLTSRSSKESRIFAILIVFVLVTPALALSPLGEKTPANAASQASASTAGFVESTYIMYNDTLVHGNFQTANTAGLGMMVFDNSNGMIYLLDSSSLTIVNPNSSKVANVVPLPFDLISPFIAPPVFDSVNGYIYFAQIGSPDHLLVFDTKSNTIVQNLSITNDILGLTYDPSHGAVYVASRGSVVVVNGIQTSGSFSGCSSPASIVFDSSNGAVYEACIGESAYSGNSGFVLATNPTGSVIANTSTGTSPRGILYNSVNRQLYLADYPDPILTVVDATTNKLVGNISLGFQSGGYANHLEFDQKNGYVYATSSVNGTILVINDTSNKAIKTVTLASSGAGLFFDPVNQNLYFSVDGNPIGIVVINSLTNSATGYIMTGAQFQLLGCNPSNGDMYVAFNDTIEVISGATYSVIDTLSFGYTPNGDCF